MSFPGRWVLALACVIAQNGHARPQSAASKSTTQPLEDAAHPSESPAQPKLERIGGTYRVDLIAKIAAQGFRIDFVTESGPEAYRRIVLRSDHIHASLKEGMDIRMSAEIARVQEGAAEASQVVLFLPSEQGPTPVWMLSRNVEAWKDLTAVPYLKMHVPQSDYWAF